MGTISQKIVTDFQKAMKDGNLDLEASASELPFPIPDDLGDPSRLIDDGHDPLHAIYTAAETHHFDVCRRHHHAE